MSKPTSTPNYKNVESKIKDEVNYHKELAKQYRKMKESIGQSGALDEDMVLGGSSRLGATRENTRDRFGNTDKDVNRVVPGQDIFEESSKYRMSKLLDSANSGQRSSLTLQELSTNCVEKAPKGRKNLELTEKTTNNHRHQDNNGGRGGILDIANSFLNSPLMQHISNFDNALKDSTNSTHTRSAADLKRPNKLAGSINGGSDLDEDMRLQSSGGLQRSRYSKGVNSILKDSTSRKYGDNTGNGQSSLASSTFSNFLNEDMKGFYQKENLDQKKPRNSGLAVRFGSSENSSNVSFSGNEAPINNNDKMDKRPPFQKREYRNGLNSTKANDGLSFNPGNVFKNERMNVTQLLNN